MARTLDRCGILVVLVCLLVTAATGVQSDRYINSSEPAFLHDMGPQDVRSDNPWAAAVTALVVAAVFYRGFHTYSPET
jgi:hypothetical protein